MSFVSAALLLLVRLVVFIYDMVSYPVYYIIYRDSTSLEDSAKDIKATISVSGEDQVTVRAPEGECIFRDEIVNHPDGITTMETLARFLTDKYGDRKCLGTRETLAETEESQGGGKVLKKLILAEEYRWNTYEDLGRDSELFARGLMEVVNHPDINDVNNPPDRPCNGPVKGICIFADTRAEWLAAMWGCFKSGITLATIYANLGDEGIVHGVTQTGVGAIITSQELLPKLFKLMEQIPSITTIIFFESNTTPAPDPPDKSIRLVPYSEMLKLGAESEVMLTPPTSDDIAIIMYTSGTTGVPKGVILSHGNMLSALLSLITTAHKAITSGNRITDDDVYIAFLPLAHVLEMLAEHVILCFGIRMGYSSPNTLTNKGTLIPKGGVGDAVILKPTVMASVPLILVRIFKGIQDVIATKGDFARKFIGWAIDYRCKWVETGFDTPIMNRIVFRKFKSLIGGKLRVLLSGGAPLTPEVQKFIRTCLGCKVLQGYGLTETSSTACIVDSEDLTVGHVGPPLAGVDLRLVNWEEGGYTVKDKNGPRGEIVIGGEHVSKGYFNMPTKTAEDFFDEDGKRFFRTGDIGQVIENGNIMIIDRKKDLVKLQHGEYVALGKVESNLRVHAFVGNVCVFADSNHNFVVALIVPDNVKLTSMAEIMGMGKKSREELCESPSVTKSALDMLTSHCQSMKMPRSEIPKAIALVPDEWTPDNGMVTAAFKVKRRTVGERFDSVIKELYDKGENPGSVAIKINNEREEIRKNQILPIMELET